MLDEPTSSLDAAARDHFLHLLSEVKQAGKTVIFTSHRLEEIEALADQVLVMEQGRHEADLRAWRTAAAPRPAHAGQAAPARRPARQRADVLQAGGFTVSRNGVGVLVDVLPSEKARPINALHDADIEVTDFEVQ